MQLAVIGACRLFRCQVFVENVNCVGVVVFRAVSVETGLLPQANGSSRLRLTTGGTDVLAAVKAEVSEPLPGHEKEGRLEVSVECWSSASPQFEGRGAAEINAELTRTLSR